MLLRKALIASSLFLGTSAFAAAPEINCSGADGLSLKLEIEYGTGLGTLTYTLGEETKTIAGLDTSFVDDVGAATKGTEVLLVVTPVGTKRIGQLILAGKTHLLRCE
ncbi:MAG: hypothetical protein FJ146_14740 [Deltaproteobacteria bacterium]|nr:hypothetical protein [Deltaproteobacteria bacterium]